MLFPVFRIDYLINFLDNLSNFNIHETWSYTPGTNKLEIDLLLYKIGKIVICYVKAIAKSNYIYNAIVPNLFRPKKEISIVGQNRTVTTSLSGCIINLSPDGTLKTKHPYNNLFIEGFAIWETV